MAEGRTEGFLCPMGEKWAVKMEGYLEDQLEDLRVEVEGVMTKEAPQSLTEALQNREEVPQNRKEVPQNQMEAANEVYMGVTSAVVQ